MGKRVERTRAGGTWTEGRFKTFIRGVLRTGFKKWPVKHQVIAANRRPYVLGVDGDDARIKWIPHCEICKQEFLGSKYVEVDHIDPMGSVVLDHTLIEAVLRLFCEKDNLRVVCKPCHKKITDESRSKK